MNNIYYIQIQKWKVSNRKYYKLGETRTWILLYPESKLSRYNLIE